jgi:hypothetical protein
MPSYIELEKNDSIPYSSNESRITFGIDENSHIIFKNNTGGTIDFKTDITGIESHIITIDSQISGLTTNVNTLINLTGITKVTEVTYSELVYLITGNTLTPMSYYIISDYKTSYNVPEYYVDGSPKNITEIGHQENAVEPIIVLATSTDTISTSAYQPTYPNDRIQYDWTWNQTEITNDTCYGRITERIDEYGNRTDYDHRTIYFNRFRSYDKNLKLTGTIFSYNSELGQISGNGTLFLSEVSHGDVLIIDYEGSEIGVKVMSASTDNDLFVVVDPSFSGINFGERNFNFYSTISTNNYFEYKEVYVGQKNEDDWDNFKTFNLNGFAQNNYIGDCSKFYIADNLSNSGFLLANNVFYSDSPIYSNTIGDRSYNNTSRFWFVRNTIRGRFYNNVMYDYGFYSNNINEYFHDNIIDGQMYSNSIGDEFYGNKIKNDFYSNTIETEFYGNEIYNIFKDNKIGNKFYNNEIGIFGVSGNTFNENTIDSQFHENAILDNFNRNNIFNFFKSNLIFGNFENNNVGFNFATNHITGYTSYNTIGPNVENNYFYGDVYANKINGGFYNNGIGTNFRENSINYVFHNNTIKNNFSRNVINFEFTLNTVGSGFTHNFIDTTIDDFNLSINYGNITGFTYVSTGTTSSNDVYNNVVSRIVNNGDGIDATFNIEVSGNEIISVVNNNEGVLYNIGDIIKIRGNDINGLTGYIGEISNNGIGKTGITGYYSNVSASGGDGDNATFNVNVIDNLVDSVEINNVGSLYVVNNVLTILGSSFGGANGIDDITVTVTSIDSVIITVTGISVRPSIYENYKCDIFTRKGGDLRLSYFNEVDILTITDIDV